MNRPEMIFIDLETTGLVANNEVPLEIALVVTDRWGNEIAAWQSLISSPWYAERIKRAKSDTVVGPMHEASGLWNSLESLREHRLPHEVEKEAIAFLEETDIKAFTLPMAGSSIGSLDRPFVQEHFQDLNNFFHYRNIDISSFKEVCRLINPDLAKSIKKVSEAHNNGLATHRALDDARASIFEYRQYVENFFFIGDEFL